MEVGKRMRHWRDPFTWRYLPTTRSLILTRKPIGQPIQRRVQGAGHVRISGLGAAEGGGGVRREFADQRGEEVSVASLSGLDQAVYVYVELLLFKGAGENAVGEVLHPGEQRQVQVIAAITAQHVNTQEDLTLCDLFTRRLALHTKTFN